MSWKPHWVDAAQKLAAEKGWHLREYAGGVLAVAPHDGEPHVAINLDDANELAAHADQAAATAVQLAFAVLDDVLKAK